MIINKVVKEDRQPLAELLSSDDTFRKDERDVALELIDSNLNENPEDDYQVLVARNPQLVGYICFGPTPMTEATYDLYWLATHAKARGQGVATQLVLEMEQSLASEGARIIRVETSSLEAYGSALAFYLKRGYSEVGRIVDFYRPGDDLITLCKRLN